MRRKHHTCCCAAGEASIITLSAPFIDDVAPPQNVSLWFAILSSAPPIGVALGGHPCQQASPNLGGSRVVPKVSCSFETAERLQALVEPASSPSSADQLQPQRRRASWAFTTAAEWRLKTSVLQGYIFGGVAQFIGWRSCFFIEACLGLPIVIFALAAPDVHLRSKAPVHKSGRATILTLESPIAPGDDKVCLFGCHLLYTDFCSQALPLL